MNCTATTKAGTPCMAAAQLGKAFCFLHDPANAETVAAARKRGGAARRDQLRGHEVPNLEHADDVRGYINRVLADTEKGLINPNAAKSIAGLCRVQLEAIREAEMRAEIEQQRGYGR